MSSNLRRSLAQRTYALVLAGSRGSRLRSLTDHRAKPAVPFGGTMRIVDFVLANCVNSGLRRIGVLTQYKAQSLIRHIERSWGFLEPGLDEYVDVVPAQQQLGERWYSGTANAVFQNLALLRQARATHVLVISASHVYKMDYAVMLAEHAASGADLSVACLEVPLEQARGLGVLTVDDRQRVVAFAEKPANPTPVPGKPAVALVSMGVYVFGIDVLMDQLQRDELDGQSSHDFGKDLMPAMVAHGHVYAHRFEDSCVNMVGSTPYWRNVATLDAYWAANLDLCHVVPDLNLYDPDWPMPARQPHWPPAKFVFDDTGRRGMAVDALVSGGSIVSGALVRQSILFRECRVGEGSLVVDSVVLPRVRIGRNVSLLRAIVDKACDLPDGLQVGVDPALDRTRFHVTEGGVTLVTAKDIEALACGQVVDGR